MSRRMRAYYYAILGAIGALVGWQATELLGLAGGEDIVVTNLQLGAVIGLCIGLLIGFAETLLTKSLIRGIRAALLTGLFGLVAGAIALPIGEEVHRLAGAQLIGRALGWATFGVLIGISAGITGGTQAYKGALGGLIGGALGGVILEFMRDMFEEPVLGKALGLVLMGASVGAFIALIVVLLSKAWLEVRSGKLQGAEFILDKFLPAKAPAATIGSDVLKADIALMDPDVAPQHAQLKGVDTHFALRDLSVKQGTFINGRRIEIHRLANREVIRMGSTEMVYHEKRRK
jgi:hypothetical protein